MLTEQRYIIAFGLSPFCKLLVNASDLHNDRYHLSEDPNPLTMFCKRYSSQTDRSICKDNSLLLGLLKQFHPKTEDGRLKCALCTLKFKVSGRDIINFQMH